MHPPEITLFAYGSLMCPDIMLRVSGLDLPAQAATLLGYRRYAVLNEPYPGIVRQPGASVTGVLYQGVTEAAWERLDTFEGEAYVREQVVIADVPAWAYVIKAEFASCLSRSDWSYAQFLREGKARFEMDYEEFDGF